MDIKKLIEQLSARGLNNGSSLGYHSGLYEEAAAAITDLLVENQSLRNAANDFKARAEAAEARAEKAEKIASDLCDDFTDFVTGGIHNAAPYCANRRPECVDGRGWCNVDMKTCRGFYPEAAKKEE